MIDNLTIVGDIFPETWIYGIYEREAIDYISRSIRNKFSNSRNILINSTWFGPQYKNNNEYDKILAFNKEGVTFDNLFFLTTVDPPSITKDEYNRVASMLGNPTVYYIGNFENSAYEFNFFSYAVNDNFEEYNNSDIILSELKYYYICYNRKPREHRVNLVRILKDNDLLQYGIVTLGKPDITYDNDPNNDLYLSIGENPLDYYKQGDWFAKDDTTGIPHDLFSLHNMEAWNHHFLYINGATQFWPWDDVYVMQDQYRPIIGLRPFLINGNPRTYKWLRNNGFKTFTQYFPFVAIEDEYEDKVHTNLLKVIQWLIVQPKSNIINMYRDMLPDLIYNQNRMKEFAKEQRVKMENMF